MSKFSPEITYYIGRAKNKRNDDFGQQLELLTGANNYYLAQKGKSFTKDGYATFEDWILANPNNIPPQTVLTLAVKEKTEDGILQLKELETLSVPGTKPAPTTLSDNGMIPHNTNGMIEYIKMQLDAKSNECNQLRLENQSLIHRIQDLNNVISELKAEKTGLLRDKEYLKEKLLELQDNHKKEISTLNDNQGAAAVGEVIAATLPHLFEMGKAYFQNRNGGMVQNNQLQSPVQVPTTQPLDNQIPNNAADVFMGGE